jgi:hypothetical protein
MLSLGRLSQKDQQREKPVDTDANGEDDEQDMDLLLDGERDEGLASQPGGLMELLLRLRGGYGGEDVSRANWVDIV